MVRAKGNFSQKNCSPTAQNESCSVNRPGYVTLINSQLRAEQTVLSPMDVRLINYVPAGRVCYKRAFCRRRHRQEGVATGAIGDKDNRSLRIRWPSLAIDELPPCHRDRNQLARDAPLTDSNAKSRMRSCAKDRYSAIAYIAFLTAASYLFLPSLAMVVTK